MPPPRIGTFSVRGTSSWRCSIRASTSSASSTSVSSRLPGISGCLSSCTNDVHYLQNSDFKPHDILLCIGTGKGVNDTDRLRYHGDQFYLKTAEEMAQVFQDYPEALANTVRIAERCHVDLSSTANYLPNFDVPAGFTLEEYFEKVVRDGFEQRLPRLQELAARGALEHTIDEYERRLSYEVEMIKQMKYPGTS